MSANLSEPQAPEFSMESIIETPFISRCSKLLTNCIATGAIGVVNGANGNGKTFALKAMKKLFVKKAEGECVYYRCCQARGYTRGIRDLLLEMGIGGAILRNNSNASFQLIIKLAQREFAAQNIKCVLLDEVELWNFESIGGLITLYDTCRDKGTPFVLVMAAAKPVSLWLAAVPSADSRTLKIEDAPYLDKETMTAVLAHWHPTFKAFRRDVAANSKAAKAAETFLYKRTRGNFRKLSFFAKLFAAANYTTATTANFRETLEKMTLHEGS